MIKGGEFMIRTFDFYLLKKIEYAFKCDFLDKYMPIITKMGNGGIIWLIFSFMFILSGDFKSGSAIIIGLLSGVLTGNLIIKNIVARARPSWLIDDLDLLIPNPRDYSFPSCHTLSSTISAVIIFSISNPAIGIAAIVLACLIAFSRLYLMVHYPSDILGGMILGLTLAYCVCEIYLKI